MKRACIYCGKIRKGGKVSEVCENCGMLKVLYPAQFPVYAKAGHEAMRIMLRRHKEKRRKK